MARVAVNRLLTPRLELVQLDFAAIDAWVARDAGRLEKLTGARFPEPVDAPPLFDADLPRIRDSLAGGRTAGPWLFVLRDTREPVGAGGTAAMARLAAAKSTTIESRRTTPTNVRAWIWKVPSLKGVTSWA